MGSTGDVKLLAPGGAVCEGTAMPTLPDPVSPSRPPQMGGGCLIAAGLIVGPIIGIFFGQVTLGLVAGGVIGVIAAVAMTVRGR